MDLTKCRTVLEIVDQGELPERITFGSHVEESPDDQGDVFTLDLPGGLWEDLGRPEQLSITIEAGDHLSPEFPEFESPVRQVWSYVHEASGTEPGEEEGVR